jgi:hypothetical protein
VTEAGAALGSLESFAAAPALPAGAADGFRVFAEERGVTIPRSDTDDAALDRLLLQSIAFVKWGNPGLYQVDARLDPDVRGAVVHFATELTARR